MFHQENYLEELIQLRRWLHQHPELSMEELETSRFIYDYLTDAGVDCRRTGAVGVIGTIFRDPAYRTTAIRSEIDALPIQEETGLSFQSQYPGKMHACGHDGLTAVTLCLAKILSKERERLPVNVRFLFEPGEESGKGARYMMDHGALAVPPVDEVLIFHYGNQEERGMEIQRSISTAAAGKLSIQIQGKASHWFQPQDGRDALYAASRLAVEIHDINQRFPSNDPFVLGFGLMQAGNAGNIMAASASLTGSLRAFSMEDFHAVLEELKQRARLVEAETQTTISITLTGIIPPIRNDERLVKKGADIGRSLMGGRFALGMHPFLVADNAARYLENIPGMRTVFLAGKPGETAYPVHNPRFDFDERIMGDALEFLYRMVMEKQTGKL